jgi:WhiB family redox-sensing transcriptional regulator
MFNKFGWVEDANCKDAPTNLFFPSEEIPNPAAYRASAQKAREYCEMCSVQQQCLDYALRNETVGIWGGMTARQRQKERTRRDMKITSDGRFMS